MARRAKYSHKFLLNKALRRFARRQIGFVFSFTAGLTKTAEDLDDIIILIKLRDPGAPGGKAQTCPEQRRRIGFVSSNSHKGTKAQRNRQFMA